MTPFDIASLYDLSGRTAIVTGGSRGLGRAIASGLVAAGARVVIASRKADACDRAVAELEAEGGEALGVAAHMGDADDLERLVDATVERFGAIDLLVNNAANALAQPMGAFTREAWDKSYSVNLFGPVFLTQLALPYLEKSDAASVLNVVTAGAFRGAAHLSIYTSGKAALLHWTRSMSQELTPRGIRVNALAPGPFATDMMNANPPEWQERTAEATLMRRIAEPAEIIGPALFLLSPASSFVTGAVLVADGGMLA
jgi:NAD(P)-dependent dehydrogenase (short-subunit alcohol dehydrogenase family)